MNTGLEGSGQEPGVMITGALPHVLPRAGDTVNAHGSDPLAAPSEALDLAEVYETHFDFVWRTARRMGAPADQLEDVVQEVFLVLHRKRFSYDGRSALRAFLYGITSRVVADARRSFARKRAPCVPHDELSEQYALLPQDPAGPFEHAAQRESVRLLDSVLRLLPERHREVLVLSHLEQLTTVEIADCLGENVNTVYSRLRKARMDFDDALARVRAEGVRPEGGEK